MSYLLLEKMGQGGWRWYSTHKNSDCYTRSKTWVLETDYGGDDTVNNAAENMQKDECSGVPERIGKAEVKLGQSVPRLRRDVQGELECGCFQSEGVQEDVPGLIGNWKKRVMEEMGRKILMVGGLHEPGPLAVCTNLRKTLVR